MIQELSTIRRKWLGVKNHAIANEQYSRKNNIRMFGVREEIGENCTKKVLKVIQKDVELELKPEDVAVAHRESVINTIPR